MQKPVYIESKGGKLNTGAKSRTAGEGAAGEQSRWREKEIEREREREIAKIYPV